MVKKNKIFLGLILLILALSILIGYTDAPARINPTDSQAGVDLIYAGSLLNVMENDVNSALKQELQLKIKGEGHGSVRGARMITEGLRTPDIYMSADPAVNKQLLLGNENNNLINWYLSFLSNEMVIAYNPQNYFKDEISKIKSGKQKWYELLLKDGFKLGRTDPDLDPKGYRTLFMFELAAKYYNEPQLKKRILDSQSQNLVFPETELMAMLETEQIDAAVTYKSEAIERGLPYISLPDQVNLSNPEYANFYQQVKYKNEQGEVFYGEPISYTITILNNARHRSNATAVVEYILSSNGRQFFREHGFNLIPIQFKGKKEKLPEELQKYIKREK